MVMRTCKRCGKEKPFTEEHFEGSRNYCRDCRKIQTKELKTKQKNENIILYKSKRMAGDAHSRIFAKSRKYKKCYNHLDKPFEFEGHEELYRFIYNSFYNDIKQILEDNKIPSLDRIDPGIGYTKENIRVITFRENTLSGVEKTKRKVKITKIENNKEFIFNSVVEGMKWLGYEATQTNKYAHWVRGQNGGKCDYIIPRGYLFKYLL